MNGFQHAIKTPQTTEEWRAFHAIRRKVLFENRGKVEAYLENDPDDLKPGNHPLILVYGNTVFGVLRLDVAAPVARLRHVAIREDLQQQGHGRVLLRLAEQRAKTEKCAEIRLNAAVEVVGFYERCGYERDLAAPARANAVPVRKSLLDDRFREP